MRASLLEELIEGPRVLSVSELTAQLRELLEGQFPDIWVEGEVSDLKLHSSKHWYFALRDEAAQIRCVCFHQYNRLIRFRPEDGLLVRARGYISIYEKHGNCQLVVEQLEPVGIGPLELAFQQLKDRLGREGFFDQSKKQSLPLLLRSIGIVTSLDGAALYDILRIFKQRNQAVSILIAPARVQGEGAAQEIAEAIKMLNQWPQLDLIIVGRGGGSIEDLWAFNEEVVARAIYNSRVPVISAVGHEVDYTIADFVADLRASTPSVAAEMIATKRDQALEMIAALRDRLALAMRGRLSELQNRFLEMRSSVASSAPHRKAHRARQRLDELLHLMELAMGRQIKERRLAHEALLRKLSQLNPRSIMSAGRGQLELLESRLRSSMRVLMERKRGGLSVAAGKLESMSPLSVLARGYAIAFDSRNRIIKRASDVRIGERIRVRVAEGEMHCTKEGA
jgi:exodeoxyribonuclease VII large subunit